MPRISSDQIKQCLESTHNTDLVARQSHVTHDILDNVLVVAHETEECKRLELRDDASHRTHCHLSADRARHNQLAGGKEQGGGLWVVDANRNGRKLALVVDLFVYLS